MAPTLRVHPIFWVLMESFYNSYLITSFALHYVVNMISFKSLSFKRSRGLFPFHLRTIELSLNDPFIKTNFKYYLLRKEFESDWNRLAFVEFIFTWTAWFFFLYHLIASILKNHIISIHAKTIFCRDVGLFTTQRLILNRG